MDNLFIAKQIIADSLTEIIRLRKIEEAAKEVVMYSKSTRDGEYTELEVLIDYLDEVIS